MLSTSVEPGRSPFSRVLIECGNTVHSTSATGRPDGRMGVSVRAHFASLGTRDRADMYEVQGRCIAHGVTSPGARACFIVRAPEP